MSNIPDYFISYSHEDNKSEDGKSGFVDEFVKKLRDSKEHQEMFGGKINVFFDKTEIHNMSDWDSVIRSNLANSRFFITLLSPGYFKSEYCAREFDWWMQHEMHRRVLGEGTAPMLIVDVAKMYDPQAETIPDIPDELKKRYPKWLSEIRRIQSGPEFDLHDLDRAKINEALDSLRGEVKDKVRRQDNAKNSRKTGLYPRYNVNFVGRRDNLLSLRKSLIEKTAAAYSALTGLGGFGKTELALTYGHAFAWDYLLGRAYVVCENKTSISETLLTSGIAEMHGWELPKGSDNQKLTFLFNRLLEKRDKIVQQNTEQDILQTQGAHILLILDNVNKRELISKKNLDILPDFFHVIITTRENTNDIPHLHIESVKPLSEDESVELLNNLRPFANSDEEEAARNIAKLLAGFTLVVELTGAYLSQKKHVTYQKQYDHLVTNHSETFQKMAEKTGNLTLHAAETVAAVLESTLLALSPNARKALDYASVMAPDTVALGWIPELLGLDEDEEGEVNEELTGYSLLTPLENESRIASMHRLVADTVKQEIPDQTRKEIINKIREKCSSLLQKGDKFWFATEHIWNIKPISEFCLELAKDWTLEATEEEIDWKLTEMLSKAGRTLETLGKYDDALFIFKERLRIANERDSAFTSDAVRSDLGDACSNLADIDYKIGNLKSAEKYHTKAVNIQNAIAEKQSSAKHMCEQTLSYLHLGNIQRDNGNIKEAKKNYLEILKVTEKYNAIQDNDSIKFLRSSCERFAYEQLGKLEYAAGNTNAAKSWCEKALDAALQALSIIPEDSGAQRGVSISFGQLGILEKDTGNLADARKYFEKAMEINQQLVDKMPEDVATQRDLSISIERLGSLEKTVGNTAAARLQYEKALDIAQKLADKMPEEVQAQRGLSVLYKDLGNLEKSAGNIDSARTWFEKVVKVDKRLTEKMPEDVQSQHELASSYMILGDLDKAAGNTDSARKRYEMALEIDKRLANMMPDDVESQRRLSLVYKQLGDFEENAKNISAARNWFEMALNINKRLAEKTPEDIIIQQDLGIMYKQLGELEEVAGNTDSARKRYEMALEIAQKLADIMPEGFQNQRGLNILYGQLGNLENSVGNTDSARKQYEMALEIAQQLAVKMPEDVENQRNLSISYTNLGDLEKTIGNTVAARDLYEKALEIDTQLANKMPKVVQTQQDLGASYRRLGELEKDAGNNAAARKWFEKEFDIILLLSNNLPEDIHTLKELSVSFTNLGDLEYADRNLDSARTYYEKSLKIEKQLADKMPEDIGTQRNLSISYERLGDLENSVQNTSAARTCFEKALEINQRLVDKIPEDVESQRGLSVSYNRLGNLERAAGNMDLTRTLSKKSLEIAKQLAGKMPEDVQAQRDLSIAYMNHGELEKDAGNIDAGREFFKKSLEIVMSLANKLPEDVQILRRLRASYVNLGHLEKKAGKIDVAREWYEKALETAQKLADTLPEDIQPQRDLNVSYSYLGDLEKVAGNLDVARKWYEKKLELNLLLAKKMPMDEDTLDGLAASYASLGNLEKDAGNTDAMSEWYQKLLEIAHQQTWFKKLLEILPQLNSKKPYYQARK